MDTCWHQHHLAAAKIPCPRKWFFDISSFVSLCIGEYKEAAQIVAQIRQVVGAIAFEGPQTDEIVSLIKQQVRPSTTPSLFWSFISWIWQCVRSKRNRVAFASGYSNCSNLVSILKVPTNSALRQFCEVNSENVFAAHSKAKSQRVLPR